MSDLIDTHCAWLKAGGRRRRTYEARADWLRRADRQIPDGLVDATTGELTAWFAGGRWRPASRATAFYHLNAFFEWGMDPRNAVDPAEPIFCDNPMAAMIRPRMPQGRPRPVTDEELRIILVESKEPYRTAAVLAVGAGLRASEIADVRREHIEPGIVWVIDGKGGKTDSAPASAAVWEAVKGLPRGPVIKSVGGRANDGKWMSERSSAYWRHKLDLPSIGLHRLRHTYARLLREAGADIATISRAMRHANLKSTQVYFSASEAECRLAVQALRLPVPVSR